jgi:hypothetical protein
MSVAVPQWSLCGSFGGLLSDTCIDTCLDADTVCCGDEGGDGTDFFEQTYDLTSTPHHFLTVELDVISVAQEGSRPAAEVRVDGDIVWAWQQLPTSAKGNSTDDPGPNYTLDTLACRNANNEEMHDHPDLVQHVSLRLGHTVDLAKLHVVLDGTAIDNVQVGGCTTMSDGLLCWEGGLETFDGGPVCIVCPPGQLVNTASRSCVPCPIDHYGTDGVSCTRCPRSLLSKAGATSESDCTASGREYLGCYKDAFSITEARDLSEKRVAMGAGASLQMCRRICHGYRYLGLQAVDECRCGHSYGKYGVAFDKRVKSGVFTSASDLDFQGTFKYALNFGAAAGGQRIGDALFTQMRTAPKTPNVVCLR